MIGTDLTGRRFGRLTVVRKATRKCFDGTVWVVRCACGSVLEVPRGKLVRKSGPKTHCGCVPKSQVLKESGRIYPKWVGHSGMTYLKWKEIRKGARDRKLEVTVSKLEADELFLKQGGRCAMSGRMMGRLGDRTADLREMASLDRIDSSKGYVSGNIQWVQRQVNTMKMDLPEDYFIQLCKAISLFRG